MSASNAPSGQPPRMLWWLLATVLLMLVARHFNKDDPGSLIAVSLYKCHLMSLGGWGGYWLDRALFPYARPHQYVADEKSPHDFPPLPDEVQPSEAAELGAVVAGSVLAAGAANDYPLSMLRRAVIVAACLVCVGLGA